MTYFVSLWLRRWKQPAKVYFTAGQFFWRPALNETSWIELLFTRDPDHCIIFILRAIKAKPSQATFQYFCTTRANRSQLVEGNRTLYWSHSLVIFHFTLVSCGKLLSTILSSSFVDACFYRAFSSCNVVRPFCIEDQFNQQKRACTVGFCSCKIFLYPPWLQCVRKNF